MTYFIHVLRVENEDFKGVSGLNSRWIDEVRQLDEEGIDFRHAVRESIPDVNDPIELDFD